MERIVCINLTFYALYTPHPHHGSLELLMFMAIFLFLVRTAVQVRPCRGCQPCRSMSWDRTGCGDVLVQTYYQIEIVIFKVSRYILSRGDDERYQVLAGELLIYPSHGEPDSTPQLHMPLSRIAVQPQSRRNKSKKKKTTSSKFNITSLFPSLDVSHFSTSYGACRPLSNRP
jgi:hypothetical protein